MIVPRKSRPLSFVHQVLFVLGCGNLGHFRIVPATRHLAEEGRAMRVVYVDTRNPLLNTRRTGRLEEFVITYASGAPLPLEEMNRIGRLETSHFYVATPTEWHYSHAAAIAPFVAAGGASCGVEKPMCYSPADAAGLCALGVVPITHFQWKMEVAAALAGGVSVLGARHLRLDFIEAKGVEGRLIGPIASDLGTHQLLLLQRLHPGGQIHIDRCRLARFDRDTDGQPPRDPTATRFDGHVDWNGDNRPFTIRVGKGICVPADGDTSGQEIAIEKNGATQVISQRSDTPSWMPYARLLDSFLSAEPTGFMSPYEHADAVCSLNWAATIAEREDDYAFGSWPEFFSN